MRNALHHSLQLAMIAMVTVMQGCSLFPYEDKFGCNRPNNMGKCVSGMEAYEEMTTGENKAPYAKPYSLQTDEERAAGSGENALPTESEGGHTDVQGLNEVLPKRVNGAHYDTYVDANYKEVAELVDQPVTPIVKPVKTAELLFLPYSDQARVLKGERIVTVILEEPKFVLGDYLKKKPIIMATPFE